MNQPIFLDANVPIYAAGREHPLKRPCAEILLLVAEHPGRFFTDAEVLQELLHRYLALRLWPAGRGVLERFSALVTDRVEPVYAGDVEGAAALVGWVDDPGERLSVRDLLHAAVMERVGAKEIITADRGFDHLPQLTRLDPLNFASWRGRVGYSTSSFEEP